MRKLLDTLLTCCFDFISNIIPLTRALSITWKNCTLDTVVHDIRTRKLYFLI